MKKPGITSVIRYLCTLLLCLTLVANGSVLEAHAAEELTNFALNGTASMNFDYYQHSEYGSHPAADAIDGNSTTYAQAASKGQEWDLTVDLGAEKKISKFNVIVGYSNRATSYTIKYSNDGTSWADAVSVTDVQTSASTPYADNISELETPVTARYFMVDVTSVTEKDAAHTIREFEIWGVEPDSGDGTESDGDSGSSGDAGSGGDSGSGGDVDSGSDTDDSDVELTNIVRFATASMDQEPYTSGVNHTVEMAIDGDPDTFAQSQKPLSNTGASWNLTVDLHGTQEIHKFRLLTGNACRATAYEIQTSSNGQDWTTVATVPDAQQGGSSPNWTYNETVLDSPIQTAYVRLYVTSSVDNNDAGHSIREFEILGRMLDYGELSGGDESQLGTKITANISIVSASSNATDKDKIVDGDTTTTWNPGSSASSIVLDATKAHDISGIQVQYANEITAKYVIYTSEDNIRWYKEAEVTRLGLNHNIQYNQVNRRYIRLDITMSDSIEAISEIKIFGEETTLGYVPTVTETFGTGNTYERNVIAPKASDTDIVATNNISLNGSWNFCLYPELGYWEENSSRDGWSTVTLPGDAETQGYIRYYLATQSETEFESAFERTVTIPSDFAGQRVILRLNGVVSLQNSSLT